jgi:sulfonate transport system permease protein
MSELAAPAARAAERSRRRPPLAWRSAAAGLRGWIVPVALLIVWEAVVRAGLVAANLLPPPSQLVLTLGELSQGGAIVGHVLASGARVLLGFAIGAALGVLAGAGVGLSPRSEALVGPTLQGLRAIPSLAWAPLLLLWLGIDEAPKVALIAIGAFFPVYLNVMAGVQGVDRKLVEVGRIHGLGPVALARRIFLPAALPSVFTGLRSGLSLAWMFLVAAELIAASKGLGYLLTDGRETGRADVVIVAILLLAVLGKLTDGLLAGLERLCLRWRDTVESAR